MAIYLGSNDASTLHGVLRLIDDDLVVANKQLAPTADRGSSRLRADGAIAALNGLKATILNAIDSGPYNEVIRDNLVT